MQESKRTAMLKLDASWPCVWGTAQLCALTLWWCWLNRSHCNLSQSKTRSRTAISGSFQTALLEPSKGQQRQHLVSSVETLDATSKVSFCCDRQKCDNTSAVKTLHQMSVFVVVVALELVLNYRLSINLRKLKNGNGNYYLTRN